MAGKTLEEVVAKYDVWKNDFMRMTSEQQPPSIDGVNLDLIQSQAPNDGVQLPSVTTFDGYDPTPSQLFNGVQTQVLPALTGPPPVSAGEEPVMDFVRRAVSPAPVVDNSFGSQNSAVQGISPPPGTDISSNNASNHILYPAGGSFPVFTPFSYHNPGIPVEKPSQAFPTNPQVANEAANGVLNFEPIPLSKHSTGNVSARKRTKHPAPVPTAPSKQPKKPAQNMEKAAQKEAADYGFDSDTIRQLKDYANAREMGIEAEEPTDPKSQYIIHKFQEIRRQFPTWAILPHDIPADKIIQLLPGQKRQDRAAPARFKAAGEVQRRELRSRNSHKWSTVAQPPIGTQPINLGDTGTVLPMVAQTLGSEPFNLANFGAAPSMAAQTMGSEPFEFAQQTAASAPMISQNLDSQPLDLGETDAAFSMVAHTMGSEPFDSTHETVAAAPMMSQTMGNEPFDFPRQMAAANPTPFQTLGDEPFLQATSMAAPQEITPGVGIEDFDSPAWWSHFTFTNPEGDGPIAF